MVPEIFPGFKSLSGLTKKSSSPIKLMKISCLKNYKHFNSDREQAKNFAALVQSNPLFNTFGGKMWP